MKGYYPVFLISEYKDLTIDSIFLCKVNDDIMALSVESINGDVINCKRLFNRNKKIKLDISDRLNDKVIVIRFYERTITN